MRIQGIRQDLLDLLLRLGRDRHPDEFVAVLREKGGIIEELDLLPGTVSNEHSASLLIDMMPLDVHVAGSAHSHPNGVLMPSSADLTFFPRVGKYHFIVGLPYGRGNWRCFRTDGTPVEMEVVV